MDDEPSTPPLPSSEISPVAAHTDSGAAPVCPYCLAAVGTSTESTRCPECATVYHLECWSENGGCSVYGCGHAATVEPRQAIEVPSSYWGEEHKPCPACGKEILAAAVRCRHCGATFATARPQQSDEYRTQRAIQDKLPAARRHVVVLFVLSVIPFFAPIGLVAGLIWRRSHREELAALPPLHVAMHRISLIASAVLTVGLGLMSLLYIAVRG